MRLSLVLPEWRQPFPTSRLSNSHPIKTLDENLTITGEHEASSLSWKLLENDSDTYQGYSKSATTSAPPSLRHQVLDFHQLLQLSTSFGGNLLLYIAS